MFNSWLTLPLGFVVQRHWINLTNMNWARSFATWSIIVNWGLKWGLWVSWLIFNGLLDLNLFKALHWRSQFVCVTEQHYVSIFFTRLWCLLCANLCFLIHRILEFQDSQLRMRINTKPNGKQKWSETAEKWHFLWLVTRLPLY